MHVRGERRTGTTYVQRNDWTIMTPCMAPGGTAPVLPRGWRTKLRNPPFPIFQIAITYSNTVCFFIKALGHAARALGQSMISDKLISDPVMPRGLVEACGLHLQSKKPTYETGVTFSSNKIYSWVNWAPHFTIVNFHAAKQQTTKPGNFITHAISNKILDSGPGGHLHNIPGDFASTYSHKCSPQILASFINF